MDNICNKDNLQAQHGLSLFIELPQGNILFDMGQDDLFYHNARRLGCQLDTVDKAIISHGHYDHGGGLSTFLSHNHQAPVYLNPNAFRDYYNNTKYIGLDRSLKSHSQLVPVTAPLPLWDGVTLYPAASPSDCCSQGLYVKDGDNLLPDSFLHEQYLLIDNGGQRLLISGCSHRGISSILQEFNPHIFIGGMHLSHQPLDQELVSLCHSLRDSKTLFYTCHCTGAEQFTFMQNHGVSAYYLPTGHTLTL